MLQQYAPILMLLAAVVGFAVFNIGLSELAGRRHRTVGKDAAYECGMGTYGTNARLRLSIHFYLVAVLFILFDVEVLLLVPWAVAAKGFGEAGVGMHVFACVAAFLIVLEVGLAYVWAKGGLTWDR